jgi:ribosome recycling factor
MDERRVREQMDRVVELFREDIATIRTGRATPALLEDIRVSVYEGRQQLSLKELGTISVSDPRTLVFQPWDVSIIAEIKNGIISAAAGLTPKVENNMIIITLPPLTEEQRQDYVKLLHKKTEAAKVMIRNIRGEQRRRLLEEEKNKSISEDEFHRLEEQLQKITDEYIEKIDSISSKKEQEIRGE